MDAFLTSILAVIFAEMGDRTQILCAVLAIRFRNNAPIFWGLGCATLVNCAISAIAGSAINGWISEEPVRLFYGLALFLAGLGMVGWRRKVDLLENWNFSPYWVAFLGIFILQFGDKSQFIIAATAARTDAWAFAMVGGWIGTMIACIPAIILQEKLAELLPIDMIRRVAGVIFLLMGLALAFSAWGLFG